jgi:hypothetical protein
MSDEKRLAVEFMLMKAAYWRVLADFYKDKENYEHFYHCN